MLIRENVEGFFKPEILVKVDREQLVPMLHGILQDITLDEFVTLITNKFFECIQYAKLINGEKTCKKMSLLFNPHRLDTLAKNGKMTIYESLKLESTVSGLVRVLLIDGVDTKQGIYNAIRIGYNSVIYINEFPPHVARDLCKKYGLTETSKVLDPCAGWGGRMIGTSVVCNYYEAFEPCTKTYDGLQKLFEFINAMNPKFKAKIHKIPFEDAVLRSKYYDFALTSPPYFDTEIYSDEKTNSLNRYKTFNDWCEGFFLPLIENTMNALKPEGVFILNIGDKRYPLSEVLFHNFKTIYHIKELKEHLIQKSHGIRKSKIGVKGETFYELKKHN